MELLLAIVIIPIAWLLLTSARLARAMRKHWVASLGVVMAVVLGAALLLHPSGPTTDYSRGDQALRAMLQ